MLYILLFGVGLIEEFVAILYYKVAQKNYKFFCALLSMVRAFLWAYVISAIFNHLSSSLAIITIYAIGGAIGDYISLTIEPFLEKKLLKLQRKGRKKKRWFFIGYRKK